ncbi:ABC transporter ATP-binding protein [Mesomycoplasma hyopneumoniae]|uniref:ABC transporter ATP-binding protein n=1 Tax=Mesomycoplasma hyopneumoniae TaxID=2099 RepID=UPI001F0B6F35|nr:ABC transporter ATP-binding protein [Mesomycoplasma hyopneumoniae]
MVQIKNLTKKFGPRKIFDNFSLEIPENKLVFITGESGIGKTTLINLIAGFTKKDGGEILFFKDGKEEKNPLIDVVFQDFNLINSFTGFENITIGIQASNEKISKKNMIKNANFLNISKENLDTVVSDLSGGEKQRIAILRAFARKSDFILLDEPTGNLDLENAEIIFEKLYQLRKNKTILIISHNLELAKKYGDLIISLERKPVVKILKIEHNQVKVNQKQVEIDLFFKKNL